MSRYARNTQVSTDRSRTEIEATLQRYGASRFIYGWERASAVIGFEFQGRAIRFNLPLPDQQSEEFWVTPSRGYRRSPDDAHRLWEQACRQRWRALALAIKAKLEAVESGISTVENEFLAWTVLPSGQTVAEQLGGQITKAIAEGRMPRLLIGGGGAD